MKNYPAYKEITELAEKKVWANSFVDSFCFFILNQDLSSTPLTQWTLLQFKVEEFNSET